MPVNRPRSWFPILSGLLVLAFVSSIICEIQDTLLGLTFAGLGLFFIAFRKSLARQATTRYSQRVGIDEDALTRTYLYFGLIFAFGGVVMTYLSR
jgi:hypothetical protein